MAQLGSLRCILRALDGAILGQLLCQVRDTAVFFSALGLLSQRQMWAGLEVTGQKTESRRIIRKNGLG